MYIFGKYYKMYFNRFIFFYDQRIKITKKKPRCKTDIYFYLKWSSLQVLKGNLIHFIFPMYMYDDGLQ